MNQQESFTKIMGHYPWTRSWIPDDAGDLPFDLFSRVGLYPARALHWDKISHIPCLILLGEPGMGKSTAMKAAHSEAERNGKATLFRDLGQYSTDLRLVEDVFRNQALLSLLSNVTDDMPKATLFLDSLDEARLGVGPVAGILATELQTLKRAGDVFLRVACRVNEWPSDLESKLKSIWGEENVHKFVLAPLQLEDIANAAQANDVEPRAFLKAIEDAQAMPLAQRPLTLGFLLNTYKKDSRLENSQKELYLKGCQQLCEESNEGRRYRFHREHSSDERLHTAAQLAAAAFFSNRITLWRDPDRGDVPSDYLTISELITAQGNAEFFNEMRLRDTLDTSLFSGSGTAGVSWAHRSFGEFLAAWCVAKLHNLKLEQLLSIVTDASGHVIPQLHAVAVWVASERSDFLAELALRDPELAITVDPANLDTETRRILVGNLLALLGHRPLSSGQWQLYRYYRNLCHPGLAEQLSTYIMDRANAQRVRRAAIEIAGSCELSELADQLVTIALDELEGALRVAALSALAQLGTNNDLIELKTLLFDQELVDPDDELRGHLLQLLWPGWLTVSELFSALKQPELQNFLGAYRLFLWGDFVDQISPKDLSVALEWVIDRTLRSDEALDPFQNVVGRIMLLCWESIDDPNVLQAMVKASLAIFSHLNPLFPRYASFDRHGEQISLHYFQERVSMEHEKRRTLLVEILKRPDVTEQQALTIGFNEAPLYTPDDFAFLVDLAIDPSQENLGSKSAALATRVFQYERTDHVEKLFRTLELHPQYAALFEGLRFTRIDTGDGQAFWEYRRHIRQTERENQSKDDLRLARVKELVEQIQKGEYARWWELYLELSKDRIGPLWAHPSAINNITEGRIWQRSGEELRKSVLDCAKSFLLNYTPNTETWLSAYLEKGELYYPAYAAVGALYLAAAYEPEFLNGLDNSVWKRWAPFVVGYDFSGRVKSSAEPLLRLSYSKAPDEVLAALMKLIELEDRRSQDIFSLNQFEACWDRRLEQALLRSLDHHNFAPDSLLKILVFLFQHGSSDVADYARQLIVGNQTTERDAAIEATAAYSLLAFGDGSDWNIIWQILREDESFADQLISLATGWGSAGLRLETKLSERQLADLYLWLVEKYPFSSDPDLGDGGFGEVTLRHEIGRWRDSILSGLRDRGSEAAVAEIKRIAEVYPERIMFEQVLVDAGVSMQRKSWKPLEPRHILALLNNREGRLVQNGEELLQVILESLERLQKRLKGETPSAAFVWNSWLINRKERWRPKRENDFSDFVKEHLESDLTQKGVVLNREVQIRQRRGESPGQQTDIQVDAIVEQSSHHDVITAIVEVKGDWNTELKQAMRTQLKDRYLQQSNCRFGLYVVGWFSCQQWDNEDYRKDDADRNFTSMDEAKSFFRTQAEELSQQGYLIKSFVVDATL